MAKPLFEIVPGSISTTKGGYKYCQTIPVHPHAEHPKDREPRVYLHIVIMENHLGRLLKDDEEVNHKDENPSNNKLSNLELVKHDEHAHDHAMKKKFWKKSPMNKPGRKASIADFIRSLF